MKKIIKISCIVVISILVLWLSLYLVDNARYRKGDKPLFTLKTKNYLFFDGKVTEYDSLLYKMIVYNRKSMKETSFNSGKKYSIKDAIDKKILTIDELEKYITFDKQEK